MSTDPPTGNHLDDEQLSARIDADAERGQSTPGKETEAEAHLASCVHCARRLEQMRTVDEMLAEPASKPAFAERMKDLIIASTMASLDAGDNPADAPRPSSIVAMVSSAAGDDGRYPAADRRRGKGANARDRARHRAVLISGIAASIIALAVAAAITVPHASPPSTSLSAATAAPGTRLSPTALERLHALETEGPIFGTLGSAAGAGALQSEVSEALVGPGATQLAASRGPGSPSSGTGSAAGAPAHQAPFAAANGPALQSAATAGPATSALTSSAAMRCLPTAIQLAPSGEHLAILDSTVYKGSASLAAVFAPSLPTGAASHARRSRRLQTGWLVLLDTATCHVVLNVPVPL